jgi:hypothetical protein
MHEQRSPLTGVERRLLGLLGARNGSASPRELRETTRVPARTLTRALAHLHEDGLLAERSKRVVSLSPAAWHMLYTAQPTRTPSARTIPRAAADERSMPTPLDFEPEPHVHDEDDAALGDAGESRRGFWAGLLEG